MKYIMFSTVFPSYHPRAGQPTHFVEKIWKGFMDEYALPKEWHEHVRRYTLFVNDQQPIESLTKYLAVEPKYHTIRAGHRWKVGDKFSPRVWSKKAYHSPQVIIGPNMEVKKVWDFEKHYDFLMINGKGVLAREVPMVAKNDGLEEMDMRHWFGKDAKFSGQIICWNDKIEY